MCVWCWCVCGVGVCGVGVYVVLVSMWCWCLCGVCGKLFFVFFARRMEGKGEYTFPSGTKYVGEFKDGM